MVETFLADFVVCAAELPTPGWIETTRIIPKIRFKATILISSTTVEFRIISVYFIDRERAKRRDKIRQHLLR